MSPSHSDQRYYEKNGCTCGNGRGPFDNTKPSMLASADHKKQLGRAALDDQLHDAVEEVTGKRLENWIDDLQGIQDNEARNRPGAVSCDSGFRFREGGCVDHKHLPSVYAAQRFREVHRRSGGDPDEYRPGQHEETDPDKLHFKMWLDPADQHGDEPMTVRARRRRPPSPPTPHIAVPGPGICCDPVATRHCARVCCARLAGFRGDLWPRRPRRPRAPQSGHVEPRRA